MTIQVDCPAIMFSGNNKITNRSEAENVTEISTSVRCMADDDQRAPERMRMCCLRNHSDLITSQGILHHEELVALYECL